MAILGIRGRWLHICRKAGEGSKTGVIPIKRYSPKEIRAMTRDFSREMLVCKSEFASVYKCSLEDGKVVVVKQLKSGTIKGKPEFMALINIMNRVKHPNLNSLLGYCFTKDFQTLVFEFAENRDLSYHLHGKCGLSWDIRFKIVKGAAHALSYLHNECHPQIIHRDLKPANILLNSSFDAQVADFGFTKLEDKRCPDFVVTSSIKTIVYVAPEYDFGATLNDRSDVYSFGIILIEILTGRNPVEKLTDPYVVIDEWATERIIDALENDNFSGLVDPKLKGEYNKEEVYKMARVILGCISFNPKDRPSMAQVLNSLEGEPDCYYSLIGSGTSIFRDAICSSSLSDPAYLSYVDFPRPKAQGPSLKLVSGRAELDQESVCFPGRRIGCW